MRVGRLLGDKTFRRSEQIVGGAKLLGPRVKLGRVMLDGLKWRPRGDGHAHILLVDTINGGGEEVLFDIACADGRPWPKHHRPALCASAFIKRCALDSLIDGRDKQRKRSASRMARTADSLRVHLLPRKEIIDAAHPVPDAVLSQRLA